MGLKDKTTDITHAGTTLTIVGGMFTMRVKEGTTGATERKITKGPNEGKAVWELKYPALSGHIVGGRMSTGDYPGVDIDITDYKTGESFTINFPLESRYLFSLIKSLPNVDTSMEVSIEIEEGNRKTRQGNPTYNLHIVQDGKLVRDYYTEWKRDENGKPVPTLLHGMPEAEKTVRGWSFQKQEDWLLERFKEFFEGYESPDSDIPEEPSTQDVLEDAGFVETEDIPF